MQDEPEIFCPACEYRPRIEDRWDCVPSCGTSWHTFWTRGVCPGCGHLWTKTQCPACGELSPHVAWYHHRVRPAQEAEDAIEQPG
jgi:hypothetical protein